LKAAETGDGAPLYINTIGVGDPQKRGIERSWAQDRDGIDPVISYLVAATSGLGYLDLVGRMERYPIPDIPVESNGDGRLLLDVGCNWGRWSVSAARKGWRVIGIDPSLGAILAARRAFAGEQPNLGFVCGDARFLPFKQNTFHCAFSYSVIQHFAETDAEICIAEMGRALRVGGCAKVQMAHKGGLRSTYIRTRRHYMDSGVFRVRYWSLRAMRSAFAKRIGPTKLRAEAFGGLGLLAEDRQHVSAKARALILASTLLRKTARFIRPLIYVADSVYVTSHKFH
jgi:SAM-dependent methyltransferase